MELLTRAPRPELASVVRGLTGFADRTDRPVAFRELPCTYVPVIIDLGEGWRIGDDLLGSFVAGLTEGPVVVEHPGRARCLQLDLTPLGAHRLLGLPMHELANRSVPLEDVLGLEAPRLVEALAETPGWAARFALVERAVAARLDATPPPRPEIAWALGRLAAPTERAPVGRMARELGWSHRRLIARFREEVGLPPKLVARIMRFERLVALLDRGGDPGWARAATACGYADQAHLAREVRALAGLTPTALRTERVNSVQDAAAAAA